MTGTAASKIRVVHFQRRALPTQFSVEGYFASWKLSPRKYSSRRRYTSYQGIDIPRSPMEDQLR